MSFTVYYSIGDNPKMHSVKVSAETAVKAFNDVDTVLRLNGESYAIGLKPFEKKKAPV